jgi:hypothetical protein
MPGILDVVVDTSSRHNPLTMPRKRAKMRERWNHTAVTIHICSTGFPTRGAGDGDEAKGKEGFHGHP